MNQKYDSRRETYEHIVLVNCFLHKLISGLQYRAMHHDDSKLVSPEVEVFNEFTPRLAETEYGSEQYKSCLEGMKVALDHHYANNSHHPEYYPNGVADMNLLDLVEMLCDWKAAGMRMKNGDIMASIEHNQKRFGYSDEIKQLLINTVPLVENPESGWGPTPTPPKNPRKVEVDRNS